MATESIVTYRIRGTNKLRSMLDEAVAASCWFAVTPLPDDGYALEVKNESGLLARFDAINADREAGSWPHDRSRA